MKRASLVLFVVFLNGCVSVGSKESLISPVNNDWREIQLFGNHYYEYKCQNIEIRFFPFTVRHKVNFTGLLLPIIPIMNEQDNSQNELEIEFSASGAELANIESVLINGTATEFEINIDKTKIKPLNSPVSLAAVNSVEIEFENNQNECSVPNFIYVKDSGFWHEIVWSMGP